MWAAVSGVTVEVVEVWVAAVTGTEGAALKLDTPMTEDAAARTGAAAVIDAASYRLGLTDLR